MHRIAVATVFLLTAVAGATAAPMTVKDGAGTVYQLNEDGKTYLLSPDGKWSGAEEPATEDLLQQFDAFLEKAFTEPGAPKLVEGEWPKYKACLMDAFAKLPVSAQRIIVAAPGPREAFKQLQEEDPASAKALEDTDKVCRGMVKFK